jgi:hypothetical protein
MSKTSPANDNRDLVREYSIQSRGAPTFLPQSTPGSSLWTILGHKTSTITVADRKS